MDTADHLFNSLRLSITGNLESTTTYLQNTLDKELYNGLRRSSRFDYSLRIPDKIDWL